MKQQVAVIDYGMGNLHSVHKALEHVADEQTHVLVSSDPEVLNNADKLVFPGVGAIRDCMAEIRRLGIDNILRDALKQKPILAVCVGMQALLEHSEENDGVDCIGIFPGKVEFFGADLRDQQNQKLKIPHMGWNTVEQTINHPMWHNIAQNAYFYFVHSFHVADQHPDQAGRCNYGKPFTAALCQHNLFATQFHPEKSHRDGLQLYQNFLHWDGQA